MDGEDIVDSDDSFRPTFTASPEVTADDDSDDDVIYGSDNGNRDDPFNYSSDDDEERVDVIHCKKNKEKHRIGVIDSSDDTDDEDEDRDDVIHTKTNKNEHRNGVSHSSDEDQDHDDIIHSKKNKDGHRNGVIHSSDDTDDEDEDRDDVIHTKTNKDEHRNGVSHSSDDEDQDHDDVIHSKKNKDGHRNGVIHSSDEDEDRNDVIDGSDNDDDVIRNSDNEEAHIEDDDRDDAFYSSDNEETHIEDEDRPTSTKSDGTIQNARLYRDVAQNSSDDEETHIEDEDRPTSTKRDVTIQNSSLYRDVAKNSSDDEKSSEKSESVAIINDSLSIVEVSSEDEERPVTLKQPKIQSFLISPDIANVKKEVETSPKTVVTMEQYEDQLKKVVSLEADLSRAKNALRVIKLENLPDKGKSIVDKEKALSKLLDEQRTIFANMSVNTEEKSNTARDKVEVAWDQIEAGVDAVGPRTFGKKGVAKFNAEKQLAVETLDSLHKSLDTCPTENDFADDPKGLKVELMPHQKRALAWLLWRERQKPSGGLLADDMGLGKTLTMIALILKSIELEFDDEIDTGKYRDKYPGGTLVVCPASLLNQWSGEIENRCRRGLLDFEVYHGARRETKPKRLARHDVVITTYTLALHELNKNGTLFGVRWRRIILDEAHQIRNHKSQTSEAVSRLSGKSRWALTGTPIHNKELDMYAIFKFLRCSPFDDLQVWKHWVADKSTGGDMRLHAVISSLMLRRTKAELMEKGSLQSLPSRMSELFSVTLQQDEMDVYQKVLLFSKTLFAQFLHQRAEKNQDGINYKFNGAPPDPNGEYFKMRNRLLKLNRVKEVSQHEILVLLLRLRQICCHPFLINQMLQDEDLGDVDDEDDVGQNLLEQLNQLTIHDDDGGDPQDFGKEGVGLKEASKGYLSASNPVFLRDRRSSKLDALIKILKSKLPGEDKAIIVSQWTGFLDLVAVQLDNENIPYDVLSGKIPVNKRSPIVNNFNDPNSKTKVLLLSLTAGGVGLNLIGANHLFLLDFHWNPQLESQAQDRIYRMGQKKSIYVYKFMALDTIEERIKALQEKKLDIADSMLTGSKRVASSKLTLQDLKMLFDFK